MLAIFLIFLRLGLTSFGGPVAHIGFLRAELVLRRRWLEDGAFSELLALCQFLPGPASSQMGFALGMLRHGNVLGGVAAWLGFTLPSAALMLAFALGLDAFGGPAAQGAVQGLKWAAVVVVTQALWGMARSLTPDLPRVALAVACAVLVSLCSSALAQLGVILLGGLAGLWLCRGFTRSVVSLPITISRRSATGVLFVFAGLFALLPLLTAFFPSPGLALFDSLYRVGALVFGGGHVVLPLLQAEVAGSAGMSTADFLAGYGLAQAVPGPLFSLAAYLGALLPPGGVSGAVLALLAIFVPGLLLLYAAMPFWGALRSRAFMQASMAGANAAVVGILGAALCGPVVGGAVAGWIDVGAIVLGLLAVSIGKCPPWLLVLLMAAAGIVAQVQV